MLITSHCLFDTQLLHFLLIQDYWPIIKLLKMRETQTICYNIDRVGKNTFC